MRYWMKTRLVRKKALEKIVCTNCGKTINKDEWYYREEGVDFHLHSLIARNYCEECYTKYGEEVLIKSQQSF
ncbi:MAG: hypothetical protein DRN09_04220 [Thermoplasmata archaeon]|nr:MAG: hypothetical protein DRN09_04220 [Thermoplasmata archaeon]